MTDGELFKLTRCRRALHLNVSNKRAHLSAEFIDDATGFSIRTFQNQLNPTVAQITDITTHVVLQGDVSSSVAKANPLNAAGKMNSPSGWQACKRYRCFRGR